MRMGTREAIYENVEHLSTEAWCSGAVTFQKDFVRKGVYRLSIYSYAMRIAYIEFEVYNSGERKPLFAVVNREKRSITTTKHQTWVWGAIAINLPSCLIVEGTGDLAQEQVAADKAREHGWRGIDAATLERLDAS